MTLQYLTRDGKPKLAYIYTPPREGREDMPLVMFLGGFKSDMQGTKATYLEEQCKVRGQAYVRFDYSGHGNSEGAFCDGTIGIWKDDALALFDHLMQTHSHEGGAVLVGSSMGGWIALLLALARAGAVRGLIGIAAGPDFTETLWNSELDEAQRCTLEETGVVEIPNNYSDEPYIFTKALLEDGRQHLLLNRDHKVDIPMRFIQGQKDEDVPWRTALEIEKRFRGSEIDVILIDDGDHRLSRPEDLALIDKEIQSLSG